MNYIKSLLLLRGTKVEVEPYGYTIPRHYLMEIPRDETVDEILSKESGKPVGSRGNSYFKITLLDGNTFVIAYYGEKMRIALGGFKDEKAWDL